MLVFIHTPAYCERRLRSSMRCRSSPRAVCRISARTGAGRLTPPAAVARARRARSLPLRMASSMARLRTSLRRKSAEVPVQMPLDLALGLGHEAEAGAIAPQAAAAPTAKEPAYQSGLSRLGRAPSSCSRVSHHARWSDSARAACAEQRARAGARAMSGLAVIQGLGGELAGVVDAHERGAGAALGFGQGGAGLSGRPGTGRLARAGANTARRARSSAAMAESSERPDSIFKDTIIGAIAGRRCPAPPGSRAVAGRPARAFALPHLLEYTSPPFFGPDRS